MSSTRRRLAPSLGIIATAALVLAGCDQPAQQPPVQQPPAQATQAAAPAPAPTPQPVSLSEPQQASAEYTKPFDIKDSQLPPLPETGFPAARPMEVVNAVFKFAARHPEVLSKVPCFCGCERMGHRGNDDCFVKSRDARGVPTEWEAHGLG